MSDFNIVIRLFGPNVAESEQHITVSREEIFQIDLRGPDGRRVALVRGEGVNFHTRSVKVTDQLGNKRYIGRIDCPGEEV